MFFWCDYIEDNKQVDKGNTPLLTLNVCGINRGLVDFKFMTVFSTGLTHETLHLWNSIGADVIRILPAETHVAWSLFFRLDHNLRAKFSRTSSELEWILKNSAVITVSFKKTVNTFFFLRISNTDQTNDRNITWWVIARVIRFTDQKNIKIVRAHAIWYFTDMERSMIQDLFSS